jgi:hypothetical protein
MEAKAEHYHDFVTGSTPPPLKMTTTTMRDTTRGQRGARQQWGAGPNKSYNEGARKGRQRWVGGGQATVGGSTTLVMHMNWTFFSDRSVAIMY